MCLAYVVLGNDFVANVQWRSAWTNDHDFEHRIVTAKPNLLIEMGKAGDTI